MQSNSAEKPNQTQEHLCPDDLFSLLDEKNKKMIMDSKHDAEIGYFVGKYLVEGANNFPQNTEIGLKFLEDSMEKGSSDSLFYICQLLITKNDYVKNDFERAIKLYRSYYDKTDPRYNYISGIIYRKKRNHKKAFKCFQRSLMSGNSDAYFNYAQMLFYGQGCTKDKDKANEYFKMAKLNGCTKCDQYLIKNRSALQREINSPYEKSADIVYLLDGTESMNRFIQLENFSDFCNKLIYKLWDTYPKVYFRFGVVLYRDTAVTSCFKNGKIEKVTVQFLTKRPSDIKRFLNNSVYLRGGFDGPEDWASGYECLLDKIEWDDNSEKIVIHIADAPGHGKSFNGTSSYLLPLFNENNSKSMNQNIYDKMQSDEEEKFRKLIENVASKGITFFCLNLHKYASNCFNVTRDIYLKNNGKKFVIQDHFNILDQQTFDKFVLGAVSSCLNKDDESTKTCDSKKENISKDEDDDDDKNSGSDFDYEYEVSKFFKSNDDDELAHSISMDEYSESQKDEEKEEKKDQNKEIDLKNSKEIDVKNNKEIDVKNSKEIDVKNNKEIDVKNNKEIDLKNNSNNDNENSKNNDNDNDKSSDSYFDYEYEVNKFFKSDDDDIDEELINSLSMDGNSKSQTKEIEEKKDQNKEIDSKNNNNDKNNKNNSDSDFDYEYEINKFLKSDDDGKKKHSHHFSKDGDSESQKKEELEEKKDQTKQIVLTNNNNDNINSVNKENNDNDKNNNDNNSKNNSDSDFDYEYEVNKFFRSDDVDEYAHSFSEDSDFDYESEVNKQSVST